MAQNIYDNEKFFNSYKALRETDTNYNVLLEQPAMKKLLPDLQGKTILDIGCGFGNNCVDFIGAGAKSVTGIDISERMLSVAESENNVDGIEYIRMDMKDISSLNKKFDLVYSSLAFNYEEDFERLINDIFDLLNTNGILLFSQEHPVVTASAGKADYYMVDENGNKVFCFCDYQDEKIRRVEKWFVDGVIKYHRTFSTIINTLIDKGFVIEKVVEPVPSEEALQKRKGLRKEFIKPTFLIVKARKG